MDLLVVAPLVPGRASRLMEAEELSLTAISFFFLLLELLLQWLMCSARFTAITGFVGSASLISLMICEKFKFYC